MKRALLDELLAARAAKRPVALVTNLKSGDQTLAYETENEPDSEVQSALREDRSRSVESDGGTLFVQVFNPPMRLAIVGAVHITQPLAHMAEMAGYAVTVIDPRRAFASDERFPGIAISRDWPDEAMRALAPDSRTAVVTLTHDPKLDDPALAVALASPAFYIGSLGSKRTHGKRRERLAEMGFDEAAISRIHGPIGLDIGAKSPAEIAVSIIAEITEVRRKGQAA